MGGGTDSTISHVFHKVLPPIYPSHEELDQNAPNPASLSGGCYRKRPKAGGSHSKTVGSGFRQEIRSCFPSSQRGRT
jgi:hypothetical protein